MKTWQKINEKWIEINESSNYDYDGLKQNGSFSDVIYKNINTGKKEIVLSINTSIVLNKIIDKILVLVDNELKG